MTNQIPQLPPKWVIAVINERITINPLTGVMTWKKDFRQMKKGAVVGSPNDKGYIRVRLYKKEYGHKQVLGHQVAWYLYYGEWPKHRLDHKDGNEGNNSKINLRKATGQQNSRNKKLLSNNKSGLRGIRRQVYKNKNGSTTEYYQPRIFINNKRIYLGNYKSPEEAVKAREKAERKYFKEFSFIESRTTKSRFYFRLGRPGFQPLRS